MKKIFKNRVLSDSIALTLVKLFTMAVSIVSTMVLSKQLDLVSFGTYSTGNLIINTATSLSALGLLDAVNYYYNGQPEKSRKKYVDTVFLLVIVSGIMAGIIILIFANYIQNYFHNPMLTSILAYVAFRPMIANIGLGMQNLQVSIGKAKVVAIRNSIISCSKLAVVIFVAFVTREITTIFICMLIVEAVSLIFYYSVLYKNDVRIQPYKFDVRLIGKILAYCIPMGVYIQTNALSRDLDKYVIGFFEPTDKLAIFANASTKLPFDIISGPLLVVLIPILTKCINRNDYDNGLKLFKANIKVGYTITFILGAIVIALSKPVMLLLYGDKYLSGRNIFEIYVLVDMINFISFSIVLGAKGKTKILMLVSSIALVANLGINYLFYYLWGFPGPAYATVLVVFVTNTVLLCLSAKVFDTNIFKLFDWKHMIKLLVELVILVFLIRGGSMILDNFGVHYLIELVILGGVGLLLGVLFNYKELKESLGQLDQINSNVS